MTRALSFIWIFWGMISPCLAEELNLGVSISTSAQRETFYTLAREFERQNPETVIHFKALTSEVYKEEFPAMLSKDGDFDVLYWHSGQRLFEFVDQGLVLPIDDLWQENKLDEVFEHSVIESLVSEQKHYGIPISYYQIGFYYSKSLFTRLSLTEPTSWQEFMAVCEAIKNADIPPIFIGTKSNWPATAWFDYLNLRINGLVFHQQLTRGQIPFTDERVLAVFQAWLEPIEKGYFIAEHEKMSWREGLPFLFRDLVGMSMIGNYVIQDLPPSVMPKLGFFPFPQVDENIASYEEAPIDVLIIPRQAKNVLLAKRFLAFAARHDVQSWLNERLGVISPNKFAQQNTSQLIKEAYIVLSGAAGVSQFFDRDATKAFADSAMPILDNFMIDPNVEKTVVELEKVRQTLFLSADVLPRQRNLLRSHE